MTEVADVLVTGGDAIRRSGSAFRVARADVAITGGVVTAVIPEGHSSPRAAEEVDASGCLVSPGFVNAHTHSYGMLARGYVDGLPLEPWMPYATAFTVDRTPREIQLAATLAGIESLRSGTTTLLDHIGGTIGDLSAAAQAYADLGVRAVIAPMVGDIPLHRTVVRDPLPWPAALWHELDSAKAPDPAALLRGIADLHAEWDGAAGRLRIFVGPSGPQRCTRELLVGCARLAEELDTGVHTHLLESRNQAIVGRGLPGGSMVGYLDQLGLLSARFSGAHGVWCSDSELALLAERGAALVHNPWSNLNLGSGIAPLPSWRQHGVTGALGTDGVNCGGDLRMPLAMRLAANLHRVTSSVVADWPTVHDVYAMATEDGARALGMGDTLGAVEAGMAADLVVVEARTPGFVPRHDPIAQLVLGETGDGVRDVLVAGELVLRDRRVLTVDEAEILAEASDAAERITERNARLFDLADAQAPLLTAAAEQTQNPPA